MSLNAYAEYKPSGVEWLGDVPAHWGVAPLGKHFTLRSETVSDKDFAPLSVTMAGVVPQMENVAKTDNGDSRKLVRRGDFVINSRSDRKGSSGIADRDGSVSTISIVLVPRGIDPRFAHHLLRSVPFQEEFYRFGTGIVADLWSTRFSSMKSIRLALPKIPEQLAIANYLGRELDEIDAFIADQEQLIALLGERRTATIDRATTVGLDPYAPKKQSDINWIGVVPQHWTLATLSRLNPLQESGVSVNGHREPALEGDIGVLKTGAASKGYFDPGENKKVAAEDLARVTCPLRDGWLLINRANTPDLVGSVAFVTDAPAKLYLSDKLWQINFRDADNKFMYWWTSSTAYKSQLQFHRVGASSSMQNLSYSDFKSLDLAVPPFNEQQEIAAYLDHETAEIDAAIADARDAISLSRERRAALISAAVTGKIDVRDVAAPASTNKVGAEPVGVA